MSGRSAAEMDDSQELPVSLHTITPTHINIVYDEHKGLGSCEIHCVAELINRLSN